MRRFLPAILLAILMVAVATPANAGYLIIRVILEGKGGGASGMGGASVEMMDPMMMGGGGPIGPDGSTGTTTPAGKAEADPTRSLVVVIPVTQDLTKQTTFYPKAFHPYSNPVWTPKLTVVRGSEKTVTNLFADGSTIQWYNNLKETPEFLRTHEILVRDRYAKWVKTKSDPLAGYNILVAALSHGMADEAATYADAIFKAFKDTKTGLPPEVVGFIRAYAPMEKRIMGSATKRGNALYWQEKLDAPVVTPTAHYSIISWDSTDEEIRLRSLRLEQNFKAFYIWHAVRGIELPVPEAPLAVVLPKQSRDVIELLRALDGPSRLPADGFYAPEHDVLVLAPERLDAMGLTFAAQTQQIYQSGIRRKDLLDGLGPEIDKDGRNGRRKPDDVALMQTMALVERYADENSNIHAISREGSLQLLYASGKLPRHVAVPEWITNGSANFFARPKDPAFIAGPEKKWTMTVSPTTGYGIPNYVLQRQFRDLYGSLMEPKRDRKEQQAQQTRRIALIKNVVSDAYFLGLRDAKDVNDPDPIPVEKIGVSLGAVAKTNPNPLGIGGTPEDPGGGQVFPMQPGAIPAVPPEESPVVKMRKKRERLTMKSQASAWALLYYLSKDRPADLARFMNELAALPRDLPLDSQTMTEVFCRVFGLDGSNEAFARFADSWLDYMHIVAAVGIDIPLVEPKPPTNTSPMSDPMSQPNFGAGPGGP